MSLMKRQSQVSPMRGMPIEEKNDSSSITTVTGETVQFFYSNSGTRTQDAGQAAGTLVEAVLAKNNVKNASGRLEATKVDTSLSFTSTAFTTEVPINLEIMESLDEVAWADRLSAICANFSNGDYCVDYSKGILYGKKASTQASLASATYKVNAEVLGTVTVDPSGLAVSIQDDAAFTPGTSYVNPAAFFADETAADSVNEGDIGAARMTLDRRQITAGQTTDDAAPETGTRTNLIGALADETAPDSVDEGDAGHLRMTLNRRLRVANQSIEGPGEPTIDSYGHVAISAAVTTADQQLVAAPGANKQIWVYGINFVTAAAGTISFQDEDNTAISGVMSFAANGGMAVAPSGNFSMPLWKVATNKALEVDTASGADAKGWLSYAVVSV